MHLPASLLTRIRLGVGVTALFGCDLASQEATPASDAPAPVQARAEAQRSTSGGGIASKVVGAIASTGSAPARASALPPEVTRVPELEPERERSAKPEDPTAFVPFSEPGSLTRLDPPVASAPAKPKRASKAKPAPKPAWTDSCPACGRG